MMRRVALVVAAIVVVGGLAWSQAHEKTTTADISAAEMVFRFEKSEFEFRGNCVLKISGENQATMTAPRMVFQLTSGGTQLKHLKAFGPVKVTVVTPKDAQGQRRKIVAQCQDYATYDEPTQTVELRGKGQADILILPEGPESQRLRFTMDKMRINLRSGELSATPAQVHFEGFLPAPKAKEGQ
ncbi:MAG: hypothetical protein J7M26_01360 [Armatimonadetes bacterium]|nr:hypothetical protein [Armatimonadota bacterium]